MMIILNSAKGNKVLVNTDNVLFAIENEEDGTTEIGLSDENGIHVKETLVEILQAIKQQMRVELRLMNEVRATFGAYPDSRRIHRRGL